MLQADLSVYTPACIPTAIGETFVGKTAWVYGTTFITYIMFYPILNVVWQRCGVSKLYVLWPFLPLKVWLTFTSKSPLSKALFPIYLSKEKGKFFQTCFFLFLTFFYTKSLWVPLRYGLCANKIGAFLSLIFKGLWLT